MLIRNKQQLINFIEDLNGWIENKKSILFDLNKDVSLDTYYWIDKDYKATVAYLKNYIKNHYYPGVENKLKPKGRIFIILSYNEPFILSIIPILNALVVGNEVILRPSEGNASFVKMIWQESGLLDKYGLKLNIVSATHDEISKIIKTVKAVYFFGSFRVAQKISKICGENYVAFYPEVETADVKVFNKDELSIENDANLTIEESFSHSGQTCQRIQGVFVQERFYENYLKALKQKFIKFCRSSNLQKFMADEYISARDGMIEQLYRDVEKSKPDKMIKLRPVPLLIVKPDIESEFIKNAYFLPVLWIRPFHSKEDLVGLLITRKFFLGLNIQSVDNDFIEYIKDNTHFTRYTVNTTHTNIRPDEGWGGQWPSGFCGYRSWIEYFSDKYVTIEE